MAYITESYYSSTYYGASAGSDFNRLAARASDDITLACPMAKKVDGAIDLSALSADQVSLLMRATCAQIEWYVNNGDDYNESQEVGGEAIGNWSRQTNLTQRRNPMSLAPRAKAYLEQSGLTFRGVCVLRRA